MCSNFEWSYHVRDDRCEVILTTFWGPSRRILLAFWGHVEVKTRLGSSLRALFVSDADLTSSTHPILEAFGEILERFLEIFLYIFWI